MKLTQRVGKIPDGSQPQVGASVAVRKVSDGSTITTVLTDEDGLATIQANGHYEPYFLYLGNIPGGDKYWRSDDAITAGVLPPQELPVALRVLGDGVIRGHESDLAVSLVSNGPSVSVAPGAANVAGHPFVVYSAVGLSNTRPVSGTRIDRVVLRLYPTGSATTPGKADVALLQGTVDAGAPALTQTTTVYEVSLAQVGVPAAGTITVTDERAYSGEKPPVSGVARSSSNSTTNASGAALSGTSFSLALVRAATYDISATLHALQVSVASSWALLGTFTGSDSGLSFNTPNQVALDSSGYVYVADRDNARILKLNSSGTFVSSFGSFGTGDSNFDDPTGVAVDSSGYIYVADSGNGYIKKFNSSFAFVAKQDTGPADNAPRHVATDGTYVYYTRESSAAGQVVRTSTALSGQVIWGAPGTGDGQFTFAYGIATDGTHVYVSDRDANRVQKFTTAGVYVTKWGSAGTGDGQFSSPHGVALDDSGDVWVADYGNDRLQRFSDTGTYQTQFAQANPVGVDLASGDVLWVGNFDGDTVSKWDETGGGYGEVAIDIGGSVSAYEGPGNRVSAVGNAATATATGPTTLTVQAYGKATSGTLSLQGLVLTATATPRA